jgi:hypothetical protein
MVQFRKSKKVGPFRFTLSNRGISTSAGAGPIRFSRGADGKYRRTLRVPGAGLYDTKVVGAQARPDHPAPDQQPVSGPPPGWYPDPSGASGQKYWDGAAWHDAVPAPPRKGFTRNTKIGLGIAAAGLAMMSLIANNDDTGSDKPKAETAAPTAQTAKHAPITTTTPASDPHAMERLEAAYIDNEETDRIYWERAIVLLSEQDDAVLDPSGDVNITMTHEGKRATLYRSDLDSIAYNVCLDLAKREGPAATVGWITDAFDLPRRWEGGQIRIAAIETKCPSLQS